MLALKVAWAGLVLLAHAGGANRRVNETTSKNYHLHLIVFYIYSCLIERNGNKKRNQRER